MDSALFRKYIQPLKPIPTGVTPILQPCGSIKGILFDIYGTLFISESGDIDMMVQKSDRNSQLQRLLEKHEIRMTPEELIGKFVSLVKEKHRERIASGVDFPEIEQDCIWMEALGIDEIDSARNFALEFEMIVNSVYPMPNVSPTLSTLKKMGIYLGLISNAQFYTRYLFDWFPCSIRDLVHLQD